MREGRGRGERFSRERGALTADTQVGFQTRDSVSKTDVLCVSTVVVTRTRGFFEATVILLPANGCSTF